MSGGAGAGGGGGAGAVGTINTGGAGLSSSITGSAVIRGVGGSVANPGAAGAANTGNGGGGKSGGPGAGAAGGKGVVIIAYSQDFGLASATTGSPTYSGVSRPGFHVYTFTDTGSITF